MHRYFLYIFCLLFFNGDCQTKNNKANKHISENFNCSKGLMKAGWYEHGTDDSIHYYLNPKNDFQIIVDTSLQSTDFVSFHEMYLRDLAANPDTAWLSNVTKNWASLTQEQKKEKIAANIAASLQEADSIHSKNNSGKNQIWILNNSSDTVSIKMQDWSYICILQALSKGGNWLPIQYWRFSFCGNSYYEKSFPPKTANSFVTILPNEGDYQTRLRFKLLGTDRFYFSNEFTGKIDYCKFVEDSSEFNQFAAKPKPNYKLETLR